MPGKLGVSHLTRARCPANLQPKGGRGPPQEGKGRGRGAGEGEDDEQDQRIAQLRKMLADAKNDRVNLDADLGDQLEENDTLQTQMDELEAETAILRADSKSMGEAIDKSRNTMNANLAVKKTLEKVGPNHLRLHFAARL